MHDLPPFHDAVPRRDILRILSVALAYLAGSSGTSACGPDGGDELPPPGSSTIGPITVERPDDLLVLEVEPFNLVKSADGKQLQIASSLAGAALVYKLPPQHILEEAFSESAGASPPPDPPVASMLSGPSRVVVKVPSNKAPIDLTLAGLLGALRSLPLSVSPRALPADATSGPSGPPAEPAPLETAIELPTRLLLSPSARNGFAHEDRGHESSKGRVELWHTRLGVRRGGVVSERYAADRTVRALWTRDPQFHPDKLDDPGSGGVGPFDSSLRPGERGAIVQQSSNYGIGESCKAVVVDRLMLSALGGYLDALGDWGQDAATGLSQWEHHAQMGRDSFVRTVKEGVLYPFGHRAALVTITERKIKAPKSQHAYLYKREFVVLRERTRDYGAETGAQARDEAARATPFTRVEIRTLVTPDLDPRPTSGPLYYWPSVMGKPFRYSMVGTDRAGREVRLDAPCIWVPVQGGAVQAGVVLSALQLAYRSPPSGSTSCDLHGQRVAFAPESRPDDVSLEAHAIRFDAALFAGDATPFTPVMAEAEVALEAARQIWGSSGEAKVGYHDSYRKHGFGAGNDGEVVLGIGSPLSLSLGSGGDKAGGLARLDLSLSGVSRKLGAVAGDASKVAGGQFDPASFLGGVASAKLFGVIPLSEVFALGGLDMAPRIASRALDEAAEIVEQARDLEAMLAGLGPAPSAMTKLAALLASAGTAAASQALSDLGPTLASLPAELSSTSASDGQRLAALKIASSLSSAIAAGGADLLSRAAAGAELASGLTTQITWRTPIAPWPKGASQPLLSPRPSSAFVLSADVRAKAGGSGGAGADVVASLENFDVVLLPPLSFIRIKFDRLQFLVPAGRKAEVNAKLGGIDLIGPLSFIDALKSALPLSGFSDPPTIEVTSSGVTAGYTFGLPAIAVGAFTLQNVSIGASLSLPFAGDPLSVAFRFCTREQPFTLTVSLFGGGGYVGLEVDASGVRALEAALEFGACLSLDFGVASGAVSAMGGVYFRLEGSSPTIAGYIRICGAVEVLGLICCSIELYMELAYEASSGKVVGRASIEVEVEVAFFSKTVTIETERKLAGSASDPSFADVMGPCDPALEPACPAGYEPWNEYWGAFG